MPELRTNGGDTLPQPRRRVRVWGALSYALIAIALGLCLADAGVGAP